MVNSKSSVRVTVGPADPVDQNASVSADAGQETNSAGQNAKLQDVVSESSNAPQPGPSSARVTVGASKTSSRALKEQIQLPMWPQDLRGLPNAFARSALFSVANVRSGGPRAVHRRKEIAALSGILIQYSGDELRQDDEDVFMQIVHLSRLQDLGLPVKFVAYSLLQELRWSTNSDSYKRLVDSLDRMTASSLSVTVTVRGERENYTGSLIRSFRWKEPASESGSDTSSMREWEVMLEPEIVALFNSSSYSRIDWKMRLKLTPLEKWLHSFYHSHARPYPVSVALLHKLTGSTISPSELRKFRYKLKKSLDRLVEIEFFLSAGIDPKTDNVVVERNVLHQSIASR